MKKITCLFMSLVMVMSTLFCLDMTAFAGTSTYDFTVSGDCDYTMANDILDFTNQERAKTGAAALKMDKELLDAAMTRAMEITLYFSHTRPDGSSCDTISSKLFGENIIADYGTADYAVELWMGSSGHKANILNKDFKSVGIGCFKLGDKYYAVQCFGTEEASEVANKTGVEQRSADIPLRIPWVKLSGSLWYDSRYIRKEPYMCPNETGAFECGFCNFGDNTLRFPATADNCTFVSSDPDVVSIDENGKLYSHSVGKAEVTATFKQDRSINVTCEVEVKTLPFNADDFVVLNYSKYYDYTGKPIEPDVEIVSGSRGFRKNVDYTVSFKNNTNVGTATIVIDFIREYYGNTITREFDIECNTEHKTTELVGAKKATCTTAGYSGDTYCKDCKSLIAKGNEIPALGHKNKEVRNKKNATCSVTGYSGDTYCKDCGVLISKGSTVEKNSNNHSPKTETKVTPATQLNDGNIVEQEKCQDCGKVLSSKTTKIAKVTIIVMQKTTIGYDWYYTGSQITPSITVIDEAGKTLVRGTDYSLTYDSGRTEIGRYEIKVTLKGNYSGTKTLAFNIVEKPAKDEWIKSGNRWWYKHADGSYTKNDWEKIDGKWYYFDKSGWMLTGWQKVDGSWYYMNSSGAMLTGWQKIGGSWYYMNSAGRMQIGWQKIGGSWYYMNSAGRMQHDCWVGNYYVNSSGKWVKSR